MADLTLRWHEPDVVAMVISGEWDLSDEQHALDTWERMLNCDPAGLLVDLEGCTFMDSSALRLLFEFNRTATQNELRWAVLGSGPAVRRLFDVTRAEDVLPLVHEREVAMALARPIRDIPEDRDVPASKTTSERTAQD